MEKLLEILSKIKPDVDFKTTENLIEDGILDSFDIVTLVAQISDEFDVEISVKDIIPENFYSAETILKLSISLRRLKNS